MKGHHNLNPDKCRPVGGLKLKCREKILNFFLRNAEKIQKNDGNYRKAE